MVCRGQAFHYVIRQQVSVLFCEAIDVVNDLTGVVHDLELWRVKLGGLLEVWIRLLL